MMFSVYNTQIQYRSFGVMGGEGVVLLFDLTAQWIGIWIPSGAGNFNIYDTKLSLSGFTT